MHIPNYIYHTYTFNRVFIRFCNLSVFFNSEINLAKFFLISRVSPSLPETKVNALAYLVEISFTSIDLLLKKKPKF